MMSMDFLEYHKGLPQNFDCHDSYHRLMPAFPPKFQAHQQVMMGIHPTTRCLFHPSWFPLVKPK